MLDKRILRVLDANLNRAREGLRVVEDLCRFASHGDREARRLKELRQLLNNSLDKLKIDPQSLLTARDSVADPGRAQDYDNAKVPSLEQVMVRNLHRAQEAVRVLEEVCVLAGRDDLGTEIYKPIRFELYTLEKDLVTGLKEEKPDAQQQATLRHS